ncbi:hypothetical protein ACROYT_G028075 [Oculina patagonica]
MPEHGRGKQRVLHRNLLLPCDALPLPKPTRASSKTTQPRSRVLPQPEDTGESSDDEYEMDTPFSPVTHETAFPAEVDTAPMDPPDHCDNEVCANMSDARDQPDPQVDTDGSSVPNSSVDENALTAQPCEQIIEQFHLTMDLNGTDSIANPSTKTRDRRFRNAFLELLRMKKLRASQPTVGSVRYVRRKVPFGAVEDALELNYVTKRSRLVRTASCDLAVVSDCVHGRLHKTMLKRSMSAPALKECPSLSSLDDSLLQQPSSIVITTAIIHAERGQKNNKKKNIAELPKDVNLSKGNANLVRSRSKSFHARTSTMFAENCPDMDDAMLKRPRTV